MLSTNKIKYLVHGTKFETLKSILIYEKLFDYHDRQKLNLQHVNEGSRNRKIGQPRDYILKKYNSEEVNGIYFRIGTDKFHPKTESEVSLIFSEKILKQYPDWILNTTENSGFLIDEHGIRSVSQMSGESGISFVKEIPKKFIDEINEYSELVILNSVNLNNLKALIIKKKFKNKISVDIKKKLKINLPNVKIFYTEE